LHVFQRTPHWVLPRPDRKFTKAQQQLLGFPPVHAALRTAIYWSLESRVIGFKYSKELLNKYGQQKAVEFLEQQVSDAELRRKLLPDYTIGCKRIILSSTLYPALCRSNVTLRGRDQGIREITDTGIITTEGEEIEVDLIIYATGYDATDGAVSYPIIGRNGLSVGDFWHEYPHAYLGTAMPNFPNFFVVTGPNTGIGHTSALFIIESQMFYIMRCIEELRAKNARSIEVTAEAERDYTTMIHSEMKRTVWKTGGCKSWYQSKSGHVIAMFPGFSFTYRALTKSFKRKDHVVA
jgi:cation diffusion facilitator CzcD-associated flavoprotein CzcO